MKIAVIGLESWRLSLSPEIARGFYEGLSHLSLSPEIARGFYEGLSHLPSGVNDHSFGDGTVPPFHRDNHDCPPASPNEQVDRVFQCLTPGCL